MPELAILSTVLATVLALFAAPALADDVGNDLDGTVDAIAETMPLNADGAAGTTTLLVVARNGDGKSGCNLTGSTTLTLSVSSTDTTVATVSPSSVTFTSCGATQTLTVVPHNAGSATIGVALTSNNTAGTFNLAPATFTVDVTPPPNNPPSVSVTGFTPGAVYELGVDTLPTPGCSATDDEDGPSNPTPAIDDQRDSHGLGTVKVTCSYTDGGGLNATSSSTYSVVDTHAPSITFVEQVPVANLNGWNNSSVTLTWACDDGNGSGAVDASVQQTVTTEGAAQAATGTCTDHAGNSVSDTRYVNIDETGPAITFTGQAPEPNVNGWNNDSVTLTWACDDGNGSGAVDASVQQTVTTEGEAQPVTGTCTDLADNGTESDPEYVNIDETAPTVSLVGGPADQASYYFGQTPAAPTCAATDELSGVDGSCSVSGYSASLGSHTVTANATDKAGNPGSDSRSYEVKAWTLSSFYAPVNMGGVWNTVKGGSTVPLKFEAFMGPTEITDVATLGATFTITGTTCPNGTATTDPIEMTTSGSTTLRYDSTSGQFIQNWQTPKKPGACYEVTMKSADGSSISAKFLLK